MTNNITERETQAPLVVIGAGPGGYSAAFRAADLGRQVVLIDPRATLGGVCLNEGCIPSKALLHLADVRDQIDRATKHGIVTERPKINLAKIRGFSQNTVAQLTDGLAALAKRRKVRIIRGTAKFGGKNTLEIRSAIGTEQLTFAQAIIATGSHPTRLPFLPLDERIIDSTGALELKSIPKRMLVIGGGIIGLEMAQIYSAFGAQIDIVEMADQIIPGADSDIVKVLAKSMSSRGVTLRTGVQVKTVNAAETLQVTFEGPGPETGEYDEILVAVGRQPATKSLGLGAAGIEVDSQGFIPVDSAMRTASPDIFAIGDVVGQPMLAHKAVHEAKVAAEVACGHITVFEPTCIPAVAYTTPEVAWVGLTENTADQQNIAVKSAFFPWIASGRALSADAAEGLTKLIIDPATDKVLGGAIVGAGAGDLIAELALAIEMGADATDLALTIHPHPTFSETIAFAAEAHLGTLTDL
jgi:dihydrolipoyl dehydrogenase